VVLWSAGVCAPGGIPIQAAIPWLRLSEARSQPCIFTYVFLMKCTLEYILIQLIQIQESDYYSI
jgi:hypothetical protein